MDERQNTKETDYLSGFHWESETILNHKEAPGDKIIANGNSGSRSWNYIGLKISYII